MRKSLHLSVLPTLLVGLAVSFTLAGCASYFKRKECEKTNWFQHGYDVAMAGRRLDADDLAKQCQKAEAQMSFSDMDTGFKAGMAKYCSTENVFQVGKAGKQFSYDMCDGESIKNLRARHDDGVKIFCQRELGYHFGASGALYQNVCPKNLEGTWLPEYRRGRKVYLQMMVEEKSRSLSLLEEQNKSLEAQRMRLTLQRSHLQARTVAVVENVTDPATGRVHQQTKIVPDPQTQRVADELDNSIFKLESELASNRRKQEQFNKEVVEMRAEILAL